MTGGNFSARCKDRRTNQVSGGHLNCTLHPMDDRGRALWFAAKEDEDVVITNA